MNKVHSCTSEQWWACDLDLLCANFSQWGLQMRQEDGELCRPVIQLSNHLDTSPSAHQFPLLSYVTVLITFPGC